MSTDLKPPKSNTTKTDRPRFTFSRWKRKRWVILLMAGLGGLWTFVQFLPDAIETIPKIKPAIEAGEDLIYPPKLEMTSPKHNASVPLMVSFEGTAQYIPEELAGWLCIYAPEIERYYYEPMELPARTSPNQKITWKTEPYPIGDKQVLTKESRFQVSAVLLNPKQARRVEKFRSGEKGDPKKGVPFQCIGEVMQTIDLKRPAKLK